MRHKKKRNFQISIMVEKLNINFLGLQLLQQKNWQEAVKQLNLDKNDVNYELA